MKLCPVCHIEIASPEDRCPLCGADLGAAGSDRIADAGADQLGATVGGGAPGGERPGAAVEGSSAQRKSEVGTRDEQGAMAHTRHLPPGPRFWIWEAETLVAFAGLVVVLAADLAFGSAVSWSIYPITVIGWAWLSVTAAHLLRHRPLLVALTETALLLGFLAILNLIIPGRPWFVPLALPITIFSGLGAALLTLRRRRAVLSNCALALALIGVLLAIIEMGVSHYVSGTINLSWSILTFGCLLPIIVLLLYLQRRVKGRGDELRKYFHV